MLHLFCQDVFRKRIGAEALKDDRQAGTPIPAVSTVHSHRKLTWPRLYHRHADGLPCGEGGYFDKDDGIIDVSLGRAAPIGPISRVMAAMREAGYPVLAYR